MKKAIAAILIFCVLSPLATIAANKNSERHYQELAAKELNGTIEHILPDRTRVDILTKEVAYEVDFAYKWAEGIGQALHYSTMTQRDAGLILIIEKDTHDKYVQRVLHIMRSKSLRLILYIYDNRTGKLIKVEK